MQTSNPVWQRRNNLAVLARTIWQTPGCSRRDLDRRFQIDKSSISRLVQVLIDLGLVETAGSSPPESTGGRPRVALRIRAEYGQVWGLALWAEQARLTIVNARGEVLGTYVQPLTAFDGDFERYLAAALQFAAEAALQFQLPLLGIAFGLPGWIDFDAGVIVECQTFSVAGLSPLPDLAARVPVLWENDANCGAWSCQASQDDASDALYVFGRPLDGLPEWAVGFGLVISGRLHRGWRHRAGETYEALEMPNGLLRHLRFLADFLDPRTIFLGGDLKENFGALSEALGPLGWAPPERLLQPLAVGVDEVSLGAAQLMLDELFQWPSTRQRSLFHWYGTERTDSVWRGLPASEIAGLTKNGR